MAKVEWSADWNTSIEAIDKQHHRIMDYINQLDDSCIGGRSREDIGKVIDGLIDYTLTHFAFEESLQEEAKYPFCADHKQVHDLFSRRIEDFRSRFATGEDVAEELSNTLVAWLYHHIKNEDADYVTAVKANMMQCDGFVTASRKGIFSRLFE